ncbi:type III-A CRISPR-associated protein Cas10/Csm1 [Carboxydothermus pertinax]|uniref:CRISPR system single-strand-specific deoxyribonuclease Cas10/Csm1 (subtype III-A) n=2 Tax=Carboxydothermus pertinax TaxID=870242 RepID=A0A1L8CTZ3_9THEO|nr:type III-A CRISPR-associated protein Cas10/Csm1 [Carboxydothermus pertinax]
MIENIYWAGLLHDIGKFWQRAENQKLKNEELSRIFINQHYNDELFVSLVANYHQPTTREEYIIAIADKLSAGESEDKQSGGNVASKPLISLFSWLKLTKGSDQEKYVPLKLYDPDSPPYPVANKNEAVLNGRGYQKLWEGFIQELSKHKDNLASILYLLQKYLTLIPSSADNSRATISLYDHARTTAAIAAALYKEDIPEPTLQKIHRHLKNKNYQAPELQKPYFLLVGGDIAGIQDFLYDIPMDNAAKNLRGRSFLVGYLNRLVALYLVEELGLLESSILLIGGGRFTLLLPYSDLEKLQELKGRVEKIIYQAFNGKLKFILGSIPLTINDLAEGNITKRWEELGQELNREKMKPFLSLIKETPELIFGPFATPDNICPICGREATGETGLCSFCQSIVEMGAELPKAEILQEKRVVEKSSKNEISNVNELFLALGRQVRFSDKPERNCFNLLLNSYDFVVKNCQGFYFAPKTTAQEFEALAKKSEGIETWGVLRGDVDNLGKLFREGFADKITITSIAALSRAMGEFFGVYFNDLLKEFGDKVYTVYAGGDDFFVVGSWSVLPKVALKLRRQFTLYCAGNYDLTFSAAIKLAPNFKHPLFKVAEEARELLEEKAKTGGKDKIAFLDKAYTWDEFSRLQGLKDHIKKIVQSGGSKAIIQHLYGIKNLLYTNEQETSYSKVWRLVYQLSRYRDSLAKELQPYFREKIMDVVVFNTTEINPLASPAARWAELELRARGD